MLSGAYRFPAMESAISRWPSFVAKPVGLRPAIHIQRASPL